MCITNWIYLIALYKLALIGGCVSMTSLASKEENKEIFQWTYDEMTTLCETCLQCITKYGRAHFFAWKEIQLELEKKIGRQCGANSCKYKYDTMKND